MAADTPAVITRYFDATARKDNDAVVALFADDGTVTDEGATHEGRATIRVWREGTASVYEYTTEIIATDLVDDGSYIVTGRLDGNSPAGPRRCSGRSPSPATRWSTCRSHPDRREPESIGAGLVTRPRFVEHPERTGVVTCRVVTCRDVPDRVAEGVGFEPTVSCPTHAFQACRFGRSRTPPGGTMVSAAE